MYTLFTNIQLLGFGKEDNLGTSDIKSNNIPLHNLSKVLDVEPCCPQLSGC